VFIIFAYARKATTSVNSTSCSPATPNEAVEKLFSWPHPAVNQMEYQGSNGHSVCVVCPYTRARDISSKYGFLLITVTGATNPTGDPCQAYSHHGFRGREKETMAAILKWVKSRDVTETIN